MSARAQKHQFESCDSDAPGKGLHGKMLTNLTFAGIDPYTKMDSNTEQWLQRSVIGEWIGDSRPLYTG